MQQQDIARIEDRRGVLPVGNIFRTYQANGKPPMPEGWQLELTFKTAADIVKERLTSETSDIMKTD